MTDADTPRLPRPEFRWHPDHGMFREHGGYWHHVLNRQGWGPAATTPEELATMPADAVKLGDVEALEADFAESEESFEQAFAQLQAYAAKLKKARHELEDREAHLEAFSRANTRLKEERDALRADIRAIVDDSAYRESDALQNIRALVAEPGREEPTVTPPDTNGRFVGDEFHPLTNLDGWQPANLEEPVNGD